MAAGAVVLSPAGISSCFFGKEYSLKSAAFTPLTVKFIQTGVIHEESYEGSCRYGDLENMTMEAETNRMQNALERLAATVKDYDFPKGITMLKPEGVFLWMEKGNPEIMLKDKELEKLRADDSITDVYVVTGGLPQYTCQGIAETFKKPVIMANVPGCGMETPAGLRARGHESFYVENMDQLSDLLMTFKARKEIQQTRILNLTNFKETPKGVIASINDFDHLKEKYGLEYHTVNYEEFFTEMDRLTKKKDIRKKARKLAGELINGASGKKISSVFPGSLNECSNIFRRRIGRKGTT